MPSKTKFTVDGQLIFPQLGKENKVIGPFPDVHLNAKTAYKDAVFSLSMPCAQVADGTLTGTTLSVSNTYKKFQNKLSIDLGTKFKSAATMYKHKFGRPGRALDLDFVWKEKGSECRVGALYTHDFVSASLKYNSRSQELQGAIPLRLPIASVTVGTNLEYNFTTQKMTSDPELFYAMGSKAHLRASYDIEREVGSLDWVRNLPNGNGNLQAGMQVPIRYSNGFVVKHPTVRLGVSKTWSADSLRPFRKHPDSSDAASPARSGGLVAKEEARQGPLSARLKSIDAVNLEKKRDLTAAGLKTNREGNKGTVAGHD